MNKLEQLKEKVGIQISEDLLYRILFEMNRYFDKDLTLEIQKTQKQLGRVFNQKERNILRKYYYYGMPLCLEQLGIEKFSLISFTSEESDHILQETLYRIETYGEDMIISSIKERKRNFDENIIVDNSELWLDYYKKKVEAKYDYSLLIVNIDNNDFTNNNYNLGHYFELIAGLYDSLENYRHLVIKINGKIYDANSVDITWKIIYKLGIYCENFVQFKDKFFPFKKDKSISKLESFLNERFQNADNHAIASEFYSSISTGFKFEDCFISESQNNIFLTFKKISLDLSPVPCPSCMTTIQSGNSFPEIFLRSYECKNPSCPDRSKSGRGKRFDEFGVYRFFKLYEDEESNRIDYKLYEKWRRDLFDDNNDPLEMILKYYSWDNEKVAVYNISTLGNIFNRTLVECGGYMKPHDYITEFERLPLYVLLSTISKLIKRETGDKVLENDITIINDDSTAGIRNLRAGQIGAAITSPPYYNAREYSQWPTLIMYLIDMMINAASVYDTLDNDSFYLYNIGDIVNTDNVYVESNMSKRRLQLGSLSCMFFEIVGFELAGNIIWDKGQVQSKRSSTVNLNSGYVKCVNCYEHVFVLRKGKLSCNSNHSYVKFFSPVIKINSKGENIYKHTAPYPPEMIDLLKKYIKEDKFVLDPFLGSGTTVKWCKEHHYKSVGFELNEEYYKLCIKRINE